jgi:hypothetical protein
LSLKWAQLCAGEACYWDEAATTEEEKINEESSLRRAGGIMKETESSLRESWLDPGS